MRRKDTLFIWTADHEKLFGDLKKKVSTGTTLTMPGTIYPFHIHLDSSSSKRFNICEEFPEEKRNISFSSTVYKKEKQKMLTTAGELAV